MRWNNHMVLYTFLRKHKCIQALSKVYRVNWFSKSLHNMYCIVKCKKNNLKWPGLFAARFAAYGYLDGNPLECETEAEINRAWPPSGTHYRIHTHLHCYLCRQCIVCYTTCAKARDNIGIVLYHVIRDFQTTA